MSNEKYILFGKTLSELQEVVNQLKMPAFTAKQLAKWLYNSDITSIAEMSNISKKNRELLETHCEFGVTPPKSFQESTDGTKKYLFNTQFDKFVEAAYIPETDRATLCVSSQVGCKMGCLFCMTGKQGFQGNLSAGEIANQIRSLPERDNLTNIVYMGMGEPFDNTEEVLKSIDIITSEWGFAMSPRRITVSTIGIIPGMIRFLNESNAHLAVSLHTPFDDERDKLMPINNVYNLQAVLDEIKSWNFGRQRRISFEYIMFKGVNGSSRHVNELSRLLNGIKCRINLIRFHPIPDTPLEGTADKQIFEFRDQLNSKGIVTTIRASRGQDIYAACGLLSTKELVNREAKDF